MVTSEQPSSGSRKDWTPSEAKFVTRKLGTIPTSEISQRVGHPLTSLYDFIQKQGISPWSHNNQFTGAELARRTGWNPRTVNYYLNTGRIPGAVKVGRYWRINSLEAIEKWDGRSLQSDIQLSTHQPEEGCVNCNNQLIIGYQKHWCSKGCEGEYRRRIFIERVSGEVDLERHLPAHLRSVYLHFLREELGSVINLVAVPDSYGFSFRRDVSHSGYEDQLAWAISVGNRTAINCAFLGARLAKDAARFGLFVDPETGRVPVKAHEVETVIDKFTMPNALTIIGPGEWGVGILIDLTRPELVLTRLLWQAHETQVKRNILMGNLAQKLSKSISDQEFDKLLDKLMTRYQQKGYDIAYQERVTKMGGQQFYKFYKLV